MAGPRTGSQKRMSEKIENKTIAYDDVLVLTGEFGRYQRRICPLFFLAAIPVALHSMTGVFSGAKPNFRCLLPSESAENATYKLTSNLMDVAYPWDDSTGTWSGCERYDLNFTNQDYDLDGNLSFTTSTVKCDAFVYDKTIYELTTVTEFNFVCENAWMKATTDSLFMVGIMLGAIIFGALSDRYGRKPTYCLALIVNIICGLLVAASPEKISYMISRLVLGTSMNAMYLISFVNAVEMVIPKRRVLMGVSMQLLFTCGYILTTGFAYFITNWRMLQIAVTIPSLAFLGYWWLIPESVRWLLAKGRLQEAEGLILKASLENGKELPKDTLAGMLSDISASLQSESKKPSVLDLFRYPNLRQKSLLLYFIWFVNNSTYYGLSWNTSNLGGNTYVNFAISGFVEIPALGLVFVTLDKLGRKIILCGCMIFSGISLLLIIFVPIDMPWLVVLLAMAAKLSTTASFEVAYVFSAEQYPTVIRNAAIGSCSTFARIGGIVAPYILHSSSAWTPLPYVVFGSGLLTAGLLSLLLPETLNQKLPESIEDGEAFGKKK